jgi:ATP-binding protein involved in chromosome partitioning
VITKEKLLEAAKHILDAEFNASIVGLQLIRDVMIKEQNVSATVLLTKEDEAYKHSLEKEIQEAFIKAGAQQVHLRLRPITDFERTQAKKWLQEINQVESNAVNILDPAQGVTFIAIASGKGGVGKSTVTVNLAVALARQGKRVGIIDADIYGFSIPDMMGIEERPQMVGNYIIPVERFGVKVMSMGFFVEDNAPIIWRGPMLGKMLRNFFNEVSWGDLDYMLLDLPPGTGDVALDVHQMIPQSKEIIVTTPHATAAFVAARAGAMAVHTKHEIIGVVENMSYYECGGCGKKEYIFGRGGGAKLAEELHCELLAQIPLGAPDNHIAEPDFSPSVYKEHTATGQIYMEVARKIIAN